jgi:hypothetical protein
MRRLTTAALSERGYNSPAAAERRRIIVAKAFYQSVHYEALRDRKVRRGPLPDAVRFSSAHPAARRDPGLFR